jgi:hypothetical protein
MTHNRAYTPTFANVRAQQFTGGTLMEVVARYVDEANRFLLRVELHNHRLVEPV